MVIVIMKWALCEVADRVIFMAMELLSKMDTRGD